MITWKQDTYSVADTELIHFLMQERRHEMKPEEKWVKCIEQWSEIEIIWI